MAVPATVGASPLDAPPPSPTPMGAQGAPQGFSPAGLTGPVQVPTDQLPPQMLTGIMQAAQTMAQTLDSFAQATPDKGAQLALIKNLLAQYLADITTAGAGPISPTAPGPAFPGGGIQRGLAGPGSV